jgi:hypothetical protein
MRAAHHRASESIDTGQSGTLPPRHLPATSASVRFEAPKDAALRAAQRADELLEEGDVDGSAAWRRILAAVEELRRGRRRGEPLN